MKLLIKYGLFIVLVSFNILTICSDNNIVTAYRWTRKQALADQAIKKGKDPILEKLSEVNKKRLNKPLVMDTVHYNQNSSDYEVTELKDGVSPIAFINGYLDMQSLLGISKHGYPIVTKYKERGTIVDNMYIDTKEYILVQFLKKSTYGRLATCTIEEQQFPVEIKEGKNAPSEITLYICKPSTTIHYWLCPLVNWSLLIGSGFAAGYLAYHKWFKK